MRSSFITTVAVLLFSATSQAITIPAMGESSVATNEKRFALAEEAAGMLDARSIELERRKDDKKSLHDKATKGVHTANQQITQHTKAANDAKNSKDKKKAEGKLAAAHDKKAGHEDTLHKIGQMDHHHEQIKHHEEHYEKAAKAHNKETDAHKKEEHRVDAHGHATSAAQHRDSSNHIAKGLGIHHAGHDTAAQTMHDAAHHASTPGVAHLDPTPHKTRKGKF